MSEKMNPVKKKPEDILLEKPVEFFVGGELFKIDGWTYDQQQLIFGEVLQSSLESGLPVLEKLKKFQNENPERAIPSLMKIFGGTLKKVYSLTLGKPEEWINENINLAKNIELFRRIWKTNEMEELLKNFSNLIRMVKVQKENQ